MIQTTKNEIMEMMGVSSNELLTAESSAALTAVTLLYDSVKGLLYDVDAYSGMPYAQNIEITGGILYAAVTQNIGRLMQMAIVEDDTYLGHSKLDVMFENLIKYGKEKSEDFSENNCASLFVYNNYKHFIITPEIRNIIAAVSAILKENTSDITEDTKSIVWDSTKPTSASSKLSNFLFSE